MLGDIHKKPFDEGTKAKLAIFRDYLREWLPVFLAKKEIYWNTINIYDFFSGPGSDGSGNNGTPLIILDELNPHFDNIITKKLKVNFYFNEYEKSKHEILKNTLTSEDEDLRPYSIEIENLDFKSEGFNLHKSKMTDPERLNRLIIICALAYLWLIGMGVAIFAKKS